MLSSDQLAELAAAIVATAETLGQTLSANAAKLMAEDLAGYPAAAIVTALRACRHEVKGRLTLPEILQRIQRADGHPSPDEAWAIALEASDEEQTVVMTEEIGKARLAALPVLMAGDKIGGRRTFLAAYERLLTASRSAGKPARWAASFGRNSERRLLAIEEAGRLGRLPTAEVERLAAPLRLQLAAPTASGLAIAGLLSCDQPSAMEAPPDIAHERWAEVRAEVLAGRERARERDEARRETERADLARRKAAAAEAVKRRQEMRP